MGEAQSLFALDIDPSEPLERLRTHEDKEVQTQATIQLAKIELEREEPQKAWELIENFTGTELGPGWDSSVEEIKIFSLVGIKEFEKARQHLQELQQRWSENTEVQTVAQILLINILIGEGNHEEASATLEESLKNITEEGYRLILEDLKEEISTL